MFKMSAFGVDVAANQRPSYLYLATSEM